MSKRTSLNAKYPHALPVHPIALPELILHNPISWIWFTICYIKSFPTVSRTVVQFKDGCFAVESPEEMMTLWNEGFFGKGTMSRSEPTWYDRTQKRLGLGEFKNLSIEEITILRREERKKFKRERAQLEKKQKELKSKGIVDPFIEERLKLKELRDKDITIPLERETFIRPEDDVLVVKGHLINIEQLQLQPCEVMFLEFALQSVTVVTDGVALSSNQLLEVLWPTKSADDSFIVKYVVYHYYRSLGWCVRSAIKFGTDFLLYNRGPPFHHAEFALHVVPNYNDTQKNTATAQDFTMLSGLNRVIAGVRKNLVLVFVDIPTQEEIDKAGSFQDVLSLYSISEVLLRRWVPNRNRD